MAARRISLATPADGTALDDPQVVALTLAEPDDLIGVCAQKFPRYMVPRAIEIVSDLPKTAHGKIDYQSLRAREAERATAND